MVMFFAVTVLCEYTPALGLVVLAVVPVRLTSPLLAVMTLLIDIPLPVVALPVRVILPVPLAVMPLMLLTLPIDIVPLVVATSILPLLAVVLPETVTALASVTNTSPPLLNDKLVTLL